MKNEKVYHVGEFVVSKQKEKGRPCLAVVFRDDGIGGEEELLALGVVGFGVTFTVFLVK